MKETKVIRNPFKVNEKYTRDELKIYYKNNSFMRGINICKKTNTIVIIANHTKSLYDDKWSNGTFKYTGEGRKGHQELKGGNKAIENAYFDEQEIHLFEIFSNKKNRKLVYKGIVELVRDGYMDLQIDDNNLMRRVYQFELKPLNPAAQYYEMPEEDKKDYIKSREKIIAKRPETDLLHVAAWLELSSKKNKQKIIQKKIYQRNPYLSETIKRMANGVCMLCQSDAPFIYNGRPYLESHHIVWLQNGGEDKLSNLVALCPNCHRKVHRISIKNHVTKLISKNKKEIMPILKAYEKKYKQELKKIGAK